MSAGAIARRFGTPTLVALQICIGFDNFYLGKVAPLIAQALHAHLSDLAPVFMAQQAGWALGAVFGGMLADRWGRGRVMLTCLLLGSLATFATPLSRTVSELTALWATVGLFLGMTAPSVLALVVARTSDRWRSLAITLTLAGNAVGGSLGSLVVARIGNTSGWSAGLLWAAGLLLLLAIPLGLVLRGRGPGGETVRTAPESVSSLGAAGLVLGLCFFVSLGLISIINAWQPSYFQQLANIPVQRFARVSVLQGPGAVLGMLAVGACAARWSRTGLVLTVFGGHALMLVLLGLVSFGSALFPLVYLGSALGQAAGQGLLNVVLAERCPESLRATGFGAAAAIGRLGGVLAPWLGAALLEADLSLTQLFAALALAPLAVGLLLLLRPNPAGVAALA